jgi:pimeloyl-ACP methyl ester carboxylesterase
MSTTAGLEPELKSPRLKAWRSLGEKTEFRNYSIHTFYQEGRPDSGSLLIILHGYPTCSYDFAQFIQIQKDRRILTFDFLGFGLSDKPADHYYSLLWQADLAEELVRRYNKKSLPVTILAHDMGTSVATELLARDIEGKLTMKISKVILFNGNIIIDRAQFILGQILLRSRFGPLLSRYTIFEFIFQWQLGKVFSGEYPMSPEEGGDQWELLTVNQGDRIMDRLIQYTYERERLAERWHGAFKAWAGDLQLLWGMKDPVATAKHQLAGLLNLRPSVPVTQVPSLGHYPQVENANAFSEALSPLL